MHEDAATIHLDAEGGPLRRVELGGGRVVYEGVAAKPGVMEYVRNGQTVRELVPAHVLADEAYLKAHEGLPVIAASHFDENGRVRWVMPENWRDHVVGTVLSARVGEKGAVIVRIVLQSQEGLDAIQHYQGFSPGYKARAEGPPGVDPDHGPYDLRQVERYPEDLNHLLLCSTGRGGPDVKVRTDQKEPSLMETPDNAARLDAMDEGLKALRADMADMKKRMDAFDKKFGARTDSAPVDLAPLTARLDAMGTEIEALKAGVSAESKKADQTARDAAARALRVDSAETWADVAKSARLDAATEAEARIAVQAAAKVAAESYAPTTLRVDALDTNTRKPADAAPTAASGW